MEEVGVMLAVEVQVKYHPGKPLMRTCLTPLIVKDLVVREFKDGRLEEGFGDILIVNPKKVLDDEQGLRPMNQLPLVWSLN